MIDFTQLKLLGRHFRKTPPIVLRRLVHDCALFVAFVVSLWTSSASANFSQRTWSITPIAPPDTTASVAPAWLHGVKLAGLSRTGVPDATASYGAAGVSSATDTAGVSTAWTYGGNAEPTSVARGGTTTSVSALADGSVQSATVQGQTPAHAVSQTFDAMGNPVEVTLASGARAAYQWTGDGLLRSVSIDGLGTIAFQRDETRAVTSVSAFGRSMSVTRDDLSRPVAFDLPGGKRVAISFDAASRITAIDVPGTADLSFSYDAAGDLVSSSVGGTPLSYETSPDGYLLSVRNADGVSRQLSYTSEGHLTGETTGPFAANYQTDPRGRPLVVNYGTGPHSIVWGGDDRISSVQSGVVAYQVSYDAANRFVTGVSATVGGHAFSAAYGNDKLGRLCSRAYGNVAISRDINDAGGLAATSFSAPGATASVAPTWLHGVKLVGLSRTGAPAGFATASFGYDAHNDLTSIRHGAVAEFDIDRDAEGRVTGVSFGGSALRDRTIRVQRNAAGWITRETGPFGVNEYEYRADGVRTATIRNGRRIAQAVSPAGAPAGRDGAVRLSREPDEGAVYLVGPGHYVTLTNALDAVYADFGAQDFTNAVTIRFLVDSVEGEPVLDAARWPLRPTSEHPLFLKGAFGGTDLPAGFSLSGVPFVRMERFRAGEIGTNAPAAAVSVRDAGNFVWASGLVANAPFSVSNAPNALLALSTFDFRVDASVSVLSCTNAALSGVLVLNRAGEEGVSSDGQISVSSDSDFWPLARSDGLGRCVDPGVTATLRPVSSASPLYGAAAPVPGVRTDLDGVLRHVAHPCVGAYEHLVETSVRDAGGRETGRRIAGVEDEREYDYYGRLVSFVDGETGVVSAYAYDFAGRRVRKQVGDAVTTMFYDWGGSDVVVETHDEDGDGSLAGRGDYVRHYWNEPGIDRRIGFRDEYGDGSTALYWYVTGPNGTVYAVLDGAGNVVNRYEYDSFGVIDWRHSFEGVPNRYTFQGRELDAERGDYYYRARIYDPDRGTFLGPDMNLAAGPFGEPNGMMSYVFCGNDPWTFTDPEGRWPSWDDVCLIAGDAWYGFKGGASILVNTFTFGGSDRIGLTDSTQYSESYFDVSRGCAVVAREATYAAVSFGASGVVEGSRGAVYGAKAIRVVSETRNLVLSAEQAIDGAQEIADGHYLKGSADVALGVFGVKGSMSEVFALSGKGSVSGITAFSKESSSARAGGRARVPKTAKTHGVTSSIVSDNADDFARATSRMRNRTQRSLLSITKGQRAEQIVSEHLSLAKNTKKFSINSRTRIPDFVRYDPSGSVITEVIEVKNVRRLSYTKQIQDELALARAHNAKLVLYVSNDTRLAGRFRDLLDEENLFIQRMNFN